MPENQHIVFLVCTGLGRINRGYESFARECFDSLKDSPEFRLYLVKGGGKRKPNEIVLPNIYRNSKAAFQLARLFKKDTYFIEQFTFCISLLVVIVWKRPAVIYYSDFILGTFLWHCRRIFKFRYKLLFSNGAPNLPPYKTEDHVHQLLPVYFQQAVKAGEPVAKQTLIPYGFKINLQQQIIHLKNKEAIRKKLNFNNQQKIILSVGAINKGHKRMNYVIEEVSLLPDDYFLLMIGQFEKETDELISLAKASMPGRYLITNVPFEEINDYYIAADYFMLASLNEGFGRVLIEALSNGLLPIVHDYEVTRQILGQYGILKDLRKPEILSGAIKEADATLFSQEDIINYSWVNFSWDNLKGQYEKMICQLI